MSGIGAGIDSFYEYLLKSYILFGEREDLEMFKEMYSSIMKYLRKGSVVQVRSHDLCAWSHDLCAWSHDYRG